MYLPTELHDEILQFVGKEDLPRYRLVCRDFAEHGARYLFEKICFSSSLLSLNRLANISRRPIGACVETLVWDDNGSEYEAQSFLEGLRMRELGYLIGEASSACNKSSATPENVTQDEKKQALSSSLGVFVLQAIFSGLPNLRQIYVLTGRFPALEFENDSVYRTKEGRTNADWNPTKEAYDSLRRDRQSRLSTGRYEAQTALLAAYLAGCPVSKLRAGYLRWVPLSPEGLWPGIEQAYGCLTTLRLVLEFPPGRLGSQWTQVDSDGNLLSGSLVALRHLLGSVPELRNLELRLAGGNWWEGHDFSRANLRLQDIIPSPEAFPHLRKLILHQMDTSEDFLARFLKSHCETLKILKLHSIRMNPQGSWERLLEHIQPCLKLDTIWLGGKLYNDVLNHSTDWWAMDGTIGSWLEAYMLRAMDVCPLHQANKCIE